MKKILCMLLGVMLILSACSSGATSSSTAPIAPPAAAQSGAPASQSTEAPADDAEIRVVWWGGDARHEITLEAIDLFEEAFPNITVNPEYMGNDSYWDKLATQVAGGTAPDVIQFGNNYPDYVAKDALLELESYADNLLDFSNFDKDVIELGSMNGHLYGICLGTNTLTVVYNKAMIEAAGAPLPNQSMSWDELREYLVTIAPMLPEGVFPMADNSSNNNAYLTYYMRQNQTPIHRNGEALMTPEALTKWIEMWEGYRADKLIPDAETAFSFAESAPDSSSLVAGRSAIAMIWSNLVPTYQAAMQDELDLIQLPSAANLGAWVQPSQFMCVNKKSANPEVAVSFINFFVNNPDAGVILGNDRGISSSSVVREALQAIASPIDQKVYNFYAVVTPNTFPMDAKLPNDQEFINTYRLIMQGVAYGQSTPAEGGQQVYDLAQELLVK